MYTFGASNLTELHLKCRSFTLFQVVNECLFKDKLLPRQEHFITLFPFPYIYFQMKAWSQLANFDISYNNGILLTHMKVF